MVPHVSRPTPNLAPPELKTPQADVLMDVARRQKFYASFDSYLRQCREYARAFDDPRTRKAFEKTYDVTLHKDLRSTIVAGRSTGLDARRVHELASASFPDTKFILPAPAAATSAAELGRRLQLLIPSWCDAFSPQSATTNVDPCSAASGAQAEIRCCGELGMGRPLGLDVCDSVFRLRSSHGSLASLL